MRTEGRSKMGWFWFAIAIACLLTFAALVHDGTVKLPIASSSDAPVSDSETTAQTTTTASEQPGLTTTAEVTLTTALTEQTTAPTEGETTEPTQQPEQVDKQEVRTLVIDNFAQKYHLDVNCASALRINDENRESVETTIEELEARGYVPCEMCAGG